MIAWIGLFAVGAWMVSHSNSTVQLFGAAILFGGAMGLWDAKRTDSL